jgi:hypothetical protein
LVQVLGVAALCFWLVAATLFLYAVSAPFHELPPEQAGAGPFVYAVLSASTQERQDVDSRARQARLASLLAAALTVAAFALAVFWEVPSHESSGTVTLTTEGTQALAEKCPSLTRTFAGRLEKAALEKEFVSITVEGVACGEKDAVVSVPRAQVRGVVFSP